MLFIGGCLQQIQEDTEPTVKVEKGEPLPAKRLKTEQEARSTSHPQFYTWGALDVQEFTQQLIKVGNSPNLPTVVNSPNLPTHSLPNRPLTNVDIIAKSNVTAWPPHTLEHTQLVHVVCVLSENPSPSRAAGT